MSNFKNKLLSMSGEMDREELNSLNEDHKIIAKDINLEARLNEAFSKFVSELQSFEYSLKGYGSLPYGLEDPNKVIQQVESNKMLSMKLKSIALKKLNECKMIIDEVFCVNNKEEEVKRIRVIHKGF